MSNLSIEQRLAALQALHDNFQIVSGSNVTVEGSIRHGYAVCSTCPQSTEPETSGQIIIGGGGAMPPCNGCGFFNPDDGKTYLTKTYSYVDTDSCPEGCSGEPDYFQYYGGTQTQSVLASEHYDSECVLHETFEDIPRSVYCFCDCSGQGGCGPLCDENCTGCHTDPNTNPEFWANCGELIATVTYSDECTP